MDKEEVVTEVKEVVDNGGAPVGKEVEPVVEKKGDGDDEVKDMEEDSKTEEEKIETSKMDVDKEEAEEPDKNDVKEDSESEANKEVEAAKIAEVEEGNATKPEDEGNDKVENTAGLSADDEKADKGTEKKVSKKKRGKGKPETAAQNPKEKKKAVEKKKEEPKTPVTPALASDRPVRERKSVERLVATVEKDSGKDFRVEKGPGTALKDIPNVAYKLSRKKSEETFKLLHSILFGRRGKDKQKLKIKEKLDKCVKEKLLEFCDLFDLPLTRATSKKEDIVTKLFEFLEAPHATTSELLAEKEQLSKGTKRKRSSKKVTSPSGSAPSKSSSKSRKMNGSASKGDGNKDASETEDEREEADDDAVHVEQENVNGVSDGSDAEKPERAQSEEKESDTEVGSEEDTKKRKRVSSNKSSMKKNSAEKAKAKKASIVKKASPPPKKASSKPSSSRSKVQDGDTSPKIFSRKKKTEVVKEKSPTPKKSASKEKAGKKVVKGKDKPKVEKLKPSDNELKTAIREILKQVDFNTATFTDILKLLGERFKTDLIPRKLSIKAMIQEELTKLADEADTEEEEEPEGVKADTPASAAGVDV
uniref:DEK-C domain-containing protein n=1 Tax=Daucus carota subsp. sativus TaxID=79200 RepID=A0A162ADV4_DAUCS